MANEVFQFGKYLESQGLELVGLGEDGSPRVRTPDGQEAGFDVKGLLKSLGAPENVGVEINDPTTPIQQSPVSTVDRLKLSFGNTKGSVAYLKNKKEFEDVQYNPDQGLVVKKNGAWHAVDPNLLGKGDAWEKTKAILSSGFGLVGNSDLIGDVADLASDALSTGVQAPIIAAGALAGGPAGTVPAAAGAGVVSGTLRTSLGRLIGTYEASEQEQLQDIGLESLFSMGGQALAAGAKPSAQYVIGNMNRFKNWASEGTKEMAAMVFGKLTNAGTEATEVMIENAPRVAANVSKYAAAHGGKTRVAVQAAAKDKLAVLGNLLDKADEALPRKYGELLDDVVKSAEGAKLKVNFAEVSDTALNSVKTEGIASVVEKQGQEGVKKKAIRFLTEKGYAKAAGQDAAAELLSPEERTAIKPLLRIIQNFGKAGELEGAQAAKTLRAFEHAFNKQVRKHFGKGNPELERLVTKVGASFRNSVSDQFEKAGLGKEYAKLAGLYQRHGDTVKAARSIMNSRQGLETLAGKLNSNAGKNSTAKSMRDDLVELLGDEGEKMLDQYSILHATEKFLPKAPHLGLLQASAGGSAATGIAMGAGASTVPAVAAFAAASSPRAVMAGTRAAQGVTGAVGKSARIAGTPLEYAYKGLDYIRNQSPENLKLLLQDEQLMGNIFRPMLTGAAEEEMMKQRLLQSSGAK